MTVHFKADPESVISEHTLDRAAIEKAILEASRQHARAKSFAAEVPGWRIHCEHSGSPAERYITVVRIEPIAHTPWPSRG